MFKKIFRKFQINKTLSDLIELRNRVRMIDFAITLKAKIIFSTKKFNFAKLLRNAFQVKKNSRTILNYLDTGAEFDYLRTIGENYKNLFNQNLNNFNKSESELLLQGYNQNKNKLSFYFPDRNVYIRNIYSYKWWEENKPKNEEEINNNELKERNVIKYLEGLNLTDNWDDLISQKIDDINYISLVKKIEKIDNSVDENILTFEIIANKVIISSIDNFHFFEIAPSPKKDNLCGSQFSIQINSSPRIDNEINQNSQFEISALEKKENLIVSVQNLEISRCGRKESIIENVNSIEIECIPRQIVKIENNVCNFEISCILKENNFLVEKIQSLEIESLPKKISVLNNVVSIEIKSTPRAKFEISKNLNEIVIFQLKKQNPENLIQNSQISILQISIKKSTFSSEKLSFAVLIDEEKLRKLKLDSEMKQKEINNQNWNNNRLKVKNEDFAIKREEPKLKGEDNMKVESIMKNDEMMKKSRVSRIPESNEEEEEKEDLRLSSMSKVSDESKGLKLKISIKKKEAPKSEIKYDVFGRIGKDRSKKIVDNILKDVEIKNEENKNLALRKSAVVEPMKRDDIKVADFSSTVNEKKANYGSLLGDKKVMQGHNLLTRNSRPEDLNLRQQDEQDDYKMFRTESTPTNSANKKDKPSPNVDDEKKRKTNTFLKN